MARLDKGVSAKEKDGSKPARGPGFEARRMEILRGAAILFAENGYHETSVNMLSERLGVSKPVLYYYAKNKDDILVQIGQISLDMLRAAMGRAQKAQLSGVGKLRHFFTAYTEIMCSDFGRCFAFVDQKVVSAEARAENSLGRRVIEAAIREIIVEGQSDHSIAQCSPEFASRALFGAFNAIPRWFKEGGEFDAREVAEVYIDLFVTGLGR